MAFSHCQALLIQDTKIKGLGTKALRYYLVPSTSADSEPWVSVLQMPKLRLHKLGHTTHAMIL